MKQSYLITVLISLVVALVITLVGNLLMARFNGPKSGYILTGKLFEEFNGTKEVKAKFEKLNGQQKKVLDSLYADIQTASSNISALSKSEIQRLDQNKKLFNRLAGEFQSNNKQDEAKYSAELWQQINQYVKEYGEQKKYTVIYGANGTGSIMYADSSINITNEVLLYINNRYEGKAN